MPKAKRTIVTQDDIDEASPQRSERREVIYSILVTGLDDLVKLDSARRALEAHQVSAHLIHINDSTISVPRLFTLWQGDALEQLWQEAIKAAVPSAIIDVADWTPAPGYPQGEIGVPTNE
jgi:hypothetical protein